MSDGLPSQPWPRLREWLLTGTGSIEVLARDLAHGCAGLAGVGVAIYERGRQLACRVAFHASEPASLIQLLRRLREELPIGRSRAVVLVSLLEPARIVSIDDYLAHGIDLGSVSLALASAGRVDVILAHVPCLNSWSATQFSEALIQKHGGRRPVEFHVLPTRTLWIAKDAALPTCRGGLNRRLVDLGTRDALHAEIRLVANFLRDKFSPGDSIDYAYDAWRDRSTAHGNVARKAMALSACARASRLDEDAAEVARAAAHLARLAEGHEIVGDIHDAHLFLADALAVGVVAPKLRSGFLPSGVIGAQDGEQDFFPGVVLTALAEHGELGDLDCSASLRHYTARFREEPRWPAVWWQMRAWSAVARITPQLGADFVLEMAEWVLERQEDTGAFAISASSAAPTFQTICVVEGLLAAARTSRLVGGAARAGRYVAAARRGLAFATSLVLDPSQAELFARPAGAVGGVRTRHGELQLRVDVAAHYLCALIDLTECMGDE